MNQRLYGLFFNANASKPEAKKKWVRLFPKRSYTKESAIRIFQNLLMGLSFRGKEPALRPVKVPQLALVS